MRSPLDLHHREVPRPARARRPLARALRAFTEATRAEEGCLWFDWSRSLDDPTEYVLVEAFRDEAAGGSHVQSAHFQQATSELPQYLAATPKIVNATVDGTQWSSLGEMAVSDRD